MNLIKKKKINYLINFAEKKYMALIAIFFFIFGTQLIIAQQFGKVDGEVIDTENGDPIIGATVFIKQGDKTLAVSVTDIDGYFMLSDVPAGDHIIQYQMTGYQPSSRNIVVIDGDKTDASIAMSYKIQEEIVVKARKITRTEASMLSKQKKAPVAQDAISSDQISKSPDSDAADATRRMTGVTIVGGKFIYIRGLGERYSSIMYNGSTLPSPEPDKRVVPLDIFPTSILDNIIVVKSYSPNLPGDFSGGVVQINPKDFPDEEKLEIKLSSGYQSLTTFKDFKTYQGGALDWAGMESVKDERKMPASIPDSKIGRNISKDLQTQYTRDFTNTWDVDKEKGKLPFGLDIAYGNTITTDNETKIGVITSAMFKESSRNISQQKYNYNTDGKIDKDIKSDISTYSTSKGLLFSVSFIPSMENKIRFTSFFTQQSKDQTSQSDVISGSDATDRIDDLKYQETGLLFNQITGEHFLGGIIAKYALAYSRANRNEPDARTARFTAYDDANSRYQANEFKRYYNEHVDNVYDIRPEISIPFQQWSGLKSKLETGALYTYRKRESESRRFQWQVLGTSSISDDTLYGSAEKLFETTPVSSDFPMTETTDSTDAYIGTHSVRGGFLQVDMPLVKDLRFIGGARFEGSEMITESFSPYSPDTREQSRIAKNDIMPGINFVFAVTDDSNVRAGFSQTVARPDFKEVSAFRTINVVDGEIINGNPYLEQTDINNFDLRYEYFPSVNEIIAISFFYKQLHNPIELGILPGATDEVFFFNAEKADNYGAELEMRKNLAFVTQAMQDFSLSINTAFIRSTITTPNEVVYYSAGDSQSRKTKKAEDFSSDRPLQGQSPYIVNLILNYDNKENGIDASLLYNINGRRIAKVALKPNNDVYEESVNRLDFVIQKELLERMKIKFDIVNILNPEIQQMTKIENTGKNEIVRTYQRGIDYKLQLKYVF